MSGSASHDEPEPARQRHHHAKDKGLHPAQPGAGGYPGCRTRRNDHSPVARRTTVTDRSHTPEHLAISLSAMEEALACELRTKLRPPLDDITEVMRRCVNANARRSVAATARPPIPVPTTATEGFLLLIVSPDSAGVAVPRSRRATP